MCRHDGADGRTPCRSVASGPANPAPRNGQQDVGAAADVSRQLVAKVEAGQLTDVRIGTLVAIGEALGASIDVQVRWHGEGLDRLLDAAHAGLVEQVVRCLGANGWETAVEVSFSIRGERGSVDVVGLRKDVAAILIVEVKSVVPDAGGMLYVLDRKARLGPEIAQAARLAVRVGVPTAGHRRLLHHQKARGRARSHVRDGVS